MEEKTLLIATVCLLVKDGKVLLGLKTRKIGAGCLNGPGGGVDEGESLENAAIRELEEETGKTGKKKGEKYITTTSEHLEKVAIVDFHNTKSDGQTFVCRVHFYIVKEWSGEASDTDEMINIAPYDINNLPLDQMMLADREFIPLILNGKKVVAKAMYGPYQKELLGKVLIEEVEYLPKD